MVGDGAQTARVPSVMGDYDTAQSEFTWDTARRWLDGLPGGGRNIAHEAVDRHVLHRRGDRVAFRFVDADGLDVMWTYAQLAERTSRFAEVLRAVGVGPGDLVCGLSGRIPDLYVALLGTLKARSVFSPLFSAFGPEPIRLRMAMGHARLLVTTPTLYRKKVDQLRADLPELEHVLLIGPDAEELVGAERLGPGVVPLAELWPSTTGARLVVRRHGCARDVGGRETGRGARARRRKPRVPRGQDLPVPGSLDVRRRPLSRQGRDRALART